jgi:YaiO family outer membrane protein
VIFLALAVPSATAQERAPWELQLEGARERLDRGYEDWTEARAQLAWRPAPGHAYLGGYRTTERFGQRDREIVAGAYIPLAGRGPTLHLEGSTSPTHRVLAKNTLLAEIAYPLGSGWVVAGGGRISRYTTTDVATAVATLEKYAGEWRFAYTVHLSRPEGASWGASHRAVAAWHRGELQQASLSVARGREQENVLPLGILTSDVRNATVAGVFPISERWGLTLEAAWHEQGRLYTRRTVRLGTRLLF